MSQLSFFDLSPAPMQATTKATAPAQQPRRLPARYDIEQEGEYYHVWPVGSETYLGCIYHISQRVYGLYFPGERGVCGFGFKTQQLAAAELHRLFIRKEKGLPV
jgi:hypothetical protein